MFLSVHLTAILSAACLPLGTLAIPHVEARAGSVCSSGIYGELAPVLARYSAAQSYCTSKYPVPCTTSGGAKVKRSHISTKTTTAESSTVTTKTKTSTISSTNAQASALSKLQQQAASAVSTLCSCIETPTACPPPPCVEGCRGQTSIGCGFFEVGVSGTSSTTVANVASYIDCSNMCTANGYDIFDYFISSQTCTMYTSTGNSIYSLTEDSDAIFGYNGSPACQ